MLIHLRRRSNHLLYHCFKMFEILRPTSPSSSSTSRKSKSLKTLNCCSEVVSSMLSASRVPSSEDTRLGWCSMRSSSPQLEKITYTEKQKDKNEKGLTGCFWMHDSKNWRESVEIQCVSHRRIFCEAHFLSTQRQYIHQFFPCSFLQKERENGNILNRITKSQLSIRYLGNDIRSIDLCIYTWY